MAFKDRLDRGGRGARGLQTMQWNRCTSSSAFLRVLRGLFFCLTAFLSLNPPAVAADEPPPSDPVQSAQDALAKGGRYPWYDSRQDDVRRLNVQPRTTAEDRGDKWADDGTPQKKTGLTRRFSLLGGFLQWFGLTALVLLLGLIAF